MKKPLPFLLACLLPGGALSSAGLGDDALGFLEARWPAEPSVRELSLPSTEVRALDGQATLVNVRKGSRRGFVIYAADNSTVIGYSPETSLDEADIPLQLAEMIRAYPVPEPGTTYTPPENLSPVEPIIKTRWHQLAPFNSKCPLYQGEPSAAGCTAVALAQIINHYRPESFGNRTLEYKDPKSGAEITIDYSTTSYDWANIRTDYSGSYTQAEADAVGKLVFEAGAASLCEYTPTGSSGKWGVVALLRYFGFKADFYMREYLPTDYWMNLLFSEISAGRPVVYGGTGYFYETHGTTAHEFIVDGVDADGLFHINWGWGGKADGYYDITFCKSSDSYSLSDGYRTRHLMICGIRPRTPQDEPYTEDYAVTSGTELFTDCIRTRGYTSNYYASDNAETEWDMVAVNEETGEFLDNPDTYHTGGAGIFPEWGQITRKFSNYQVKPGRYLWKLASRRKGDTEWRLKDVPMRPWMSFGEDGRLAERGYLDYSGPVDWDYGPRFTLDRFEPVTEISSGAPFFAAIRTRAMDYAVNNTVGYRGSATLAFKNTETGKIYVAASSPVAYELSYNNLYSESVVQIKDVANPDNQFSMPAGRYEVYVSDYKGEPDSDWVTDGDFTVDVKEKKTYPLLQFGGSANAGKDEMNQWKYLTGWLGSETLDQEDPAEFTLFESGWNYLTSANGVYGSSTVNVYLCPSGDSSLENEVLIGTFRADMLRRSERSAISVANNLFPLSGYCRLYIRYMTPEGERDVLPQDWKYVDPETGLGRVPTEVYISAPATPALPRIQVSDLSITPSAISFIAKNLSAENFGGVIGLYVYDKNAGEVSVLPVENVSLAPGGSARFSEPWARTVTDLSFRVQSNIPEARSAEAPITYALRTDGRAAYFRFSEISSVLPVADRTAGETGLPERFYNLQGIPVERPESGATYIRLQGSRATKIRLP